MASTFHAAGDAAGVAYTYGRSANPTWTALEQALGALERVGALGGVRIFGSGLAAVSAVFGTVLRAGDTVVLHAGAYFAARQLLAESFAPLGIDLRLVEDFGAAELAGARLVWVETPSNPLLRLTDLRTVIEQAHAAGALVAVDNTTATPLGQKPLELCADIAVCSDSKAMSGHSDLLLGHVAVRDPALLQKLDRYRTLHGGIAGPMEAWLALRSLATLPLRLERMCANAMRIAAYLQQRKEVSEVLYPGLASHPGHTLAASQMRYYGPVIGFTLRDQQAAESFLRRAALVTESTSFGGITTTAERRARWGHDGVAAGFIRLSAGCEDGDDLLADIGHALDGLDGD